MLPLLIIWTVLLGGTIAALGVYLFITQKKRESGSKSRLRQAVDETLKTNGIRTRHDVIAAIVFLVLLTAFVVTSTMFVAEYRNRGNSSWAMTR